MTDTPPGSERRGVDRRRGDRRRHPRNGAEESILGALGVGVDTQGQADSRFSAIEAGYVAGLARSGLGPPDARTMRREARRILTSEDTAVQRIQGTYAAARAALGLALVAGQAAMGLLGVGASPTLLLVCLAYAAQALLVWLLPHWREARLPPAAGSGQRQGLRRRLWAMTIGVDIAAFMAMHALDATASFNFVALLVLPVLMAGVLTSRVVALATAAAVALMLLAVAWRVTFSGQESTVLLAQTGMAGLGFFAITLLAGELSSRLAREELAARGSMELARQQAQLNRLVIEEMADGVLVVDERLLVRVANPAARSLLAGPMNGPGLSAPFSLHDDPVWAPVAAAVADAYPRSDWPDEGRDIVLTFADGRSSTLRLRMRFTRRRAGFLAEGPEPDSLPLADDQALCVLLLEDERTAQARILQEKLAAMGRLSAGIAHEIRNPLAAIAQANALLMEDELAPGQAKLARMVADNVQRLKGIVDDVMELAPGVHETRTQIDARDTVTRHVHDWAQTTGLVLGADSRLRLELPAQPLPVVFDAEHLRRVLVNLLDNAQRHSSTGRAAMVLRLAARDAESAVLLVDSDSPLIPPDIQRHLFEPFFSTRSRGTGLGLYICRELCQRYGATIEYRQRPPGENNRNVFQVTMRRAGAAQPAPGAPASHTTSTTA